MKPFHYALLWLLMSGVMATTYAQENTEIIFHKSHEPKKQKAPYSDAVQVGNIYYLSGQLGIDPATMTMVDGGIGPETEQTIKNISAVLAHHGMTLDNVVKCTVILSDIDDFSAFNEIYAKHFTKKPARTSFANSGIPANGKVEIDIIAVK